MRIYSLCNRYIEHLIRIRTIRSVMIKIHEFIKCIQILFRWSAFCSYIKSIQSLLFALVSAGQPNTIFHLRAKRTRLLPSIHQPDLVSYLAFAAIACRTFFFYLFFVMCSCFDICPLIIKVTLVLSVAVFFLLYCVYNFYMCVFSHI